MDEKVGQQCVLQSLQGYSGVWPICFETGNITHSMNHFNVHNIPFLLCIHTELQSAVHTFISTSGTEHKCAPKHQCLKAHSLSQIMYN